MALDLCLSLRQEMGFTSYDVKGAEIYHKSNANHLCDFPLLMERDIT